jgi:hypothetical protein
MGYMHELEKQEMNTGFCFDNVMGKGDLGE